MRSLKKSTAVSSFLTVFVLLILFVVACNEQSNPGSTSSTQAIAVVQVKKADGMAAQSSSQMKLLLSRSELLQLFEEPLMDVFEQETVVNKGVALTASSSSRKLGKLEEVKVEGVEGKLESYYLVARGKQYSVSEKGSCLTIAIPLRAVEAEGLPNTHAAGDVVLGIDSTAELQGHRCSGAPCSSCSFTRSPWNGSITGCKCNGTGRCNHTVTT